MYHTNPSVNALMKRGYLFLEDHEWKNAKGYFDDSLDIDPENAQAYIGMLLAELHIERECDLFKSEQSFFENYYYKKALRFADNEYQKKLHQYYLDNIYFQADKLFERAKSEEDYIDASAFFLRIKDYKDSEKRANICLECGEKARIENLYISAKTLIDNNNVTDIEKAKKILKTINNYEDSSELLLICDNIIYSLEKQNKYEKKKKIRKISVYVVTVAVFASLILCAINFSNNKKEEVIYQNFLGKTFYGEIEDDDGFSQAYINDTLNEYMIYWSNKEKRSLSFNNDGSVKYTHYHSMTALAYPSNTSKPEGFSNKYDGTYDSFKIRVALSGKVYVVIGLSSYEVTVNDKNSPTDIHDYYGMTLE